MEKIKDAELSPDRILANLKNHIELFDACDVSAGVWAYNLVARSIYHEQAERRAIEAINWAGVDGLLAEQGLRNECIRRRLESGQITQEEADALYAEK